MTTEPVDWNFPTQMAVGPGRIAELPEFCQQQGIRAPLIVTDPGLAALPMVEGNAYDQTHSKHLALPQSLSDATALFKHSRTARSLFGDAFVDHFAASRQWEASEHRKHVSDWELQRYFEII